MSERQSSLNVEITYPATDGKPMANNTKQFRWIVVIQQNLDWLFAEDPNVFVAGDLFWYPVEGRNTIVNAPDVMVVFGRPKGESSETTLRERSSYQQWKEGNIAPQVVFEILSPSNSPQEMDRKLIFYERHGVEEYYIYNPDTNNLLGWLRGDDGLDVIEPIAHWVSPRLNIRFDLTGDELQIYRPKDQRFLNYTDIARRVEQEQQRAEQAERVQREAVPKLLAMGLTIAQVAEALSLPAETVQTIAQT